MIEEIARIVVDNIRSVLKRAKSRRRLLQQQPALRTRLPFSVLIDETSNIGQGVQLGHDTQIFASTIGDYAGVGLKSTMRDAELGAYSYLAGHSFVQAASIGKFCSVAVNFTAGYGNHPLNMISTNPIFYSLYPVVEGLTYADKNYFDELPRTHIGSDVWVGANVFIKAGVTVGDGAVLAAGSIVLKDVDPYTIVGGVPAKPIRTRFNEEDTAILLTLKWWDWPADLHKQAADLIRQGDVKALLAWHVNHVVQVQPAQA